MDGREVHAVEIGSWEGRSAIWIADNILNHNPKSRLWCIDTWIGSEEPAHIVSRDGVYERFVNNVWVYLTSGKIRPMKGFSEKALATLHNIIMTGKLPEIDFVYVDGSHTSADVLSDMIMSFHMLKMGGIMIIDDYDWNVYKDARKTPRLGIDSFLACFSGRYDLIFKESQVVIKKTELKQEFKDAK
jgi:predicted O-methyltransferase YrrM